MNKSLKFSMLAVLALTSLSLQAEESAPIDKAQEILKSQTQVLKDADSFKVSMTSEMSMTIGGNDEASESVAELVVQRPNKFFLSLERAGEKAVIISDGVFLYFSAPELSERILKLEAPDSLQKLFEERSFLMLFGAIASEGMELLPIFLSSDPFETFMDEVESVTWIGEEKIEGVLSDRIRGKQPQLDWDVWVSQTAPRQLLRFVPDYTKTIELIAEQMPQMGELEIHAESNYDTLEVNPDLAEDYFQFEIPEGADVVDSLEAFAGQPAAQDDASHSLTGNEAPAFTLSSLEGNEMSFPADYKEQIVVLDFWASWCGPCVLALPVLDAITQEYKDKGVTFLAVNLREDKETISSFLDAKDLDVEVLLDEKGAVAEKYLVTGIPQTVVIDQKGIVTSVHVGYDPDIQNVLRAEFDSLLESPQK